MSCQISRNKQPLAMGGSNISLISPPSVKKEEQQAKSFIVIYILNRTNTVAFTNRNFSYKKIFPVIHITNSSMLASYFLGIGCFLEILFTSDCLYIYVTILL